MSFDALIEEVKKLSVVEREALVRVVKNLDSNGGESNDDGVDTISRLIKNPLKVPGFRPLTRDDANMR